MVSSCIDVVSIGRTLPMDMYPGFPIGTTKLHTLDMLRNVETLLSPTTSLLCIGQICPCRIVVLRL